MSLNLTKGQTLDLHKAGSAPVKKLRIGAGWDPAADGASIDLDLWLVPAGGAPLFFNNMEIPGAKLDKDDRTGGSSKDGADENVNVDVEKLENEEYTVVINLYDAVKKGQSFKDVKRAFVEVEDTDTKSVLCTYEITENGGDSSTLIAGKITKKNGELVFTADHKFSSKTMDVVCSELGAKV